jgi:hypothetical protein
MKLVPLTKGKHAIVSGADYHRVIKFKWRFLKNTSGSEYATRTINVDGVRTSLALHRFILGGNSPRIDHRNGNGLDNRRRNLRPCSVPQNGYNRKYQKHSSRFKGVSWNKNARKWFVSIMVNKRRIFLGYFVDELEAAKAYDAEALKHHKSFAKTNKEMRLF